MIKCLNEKELPITTKHIKSIIEEKFFGNVNQFSKFLGLKNSVKINRLFNKDLRNNKYPEPSIDVLKLISEKCNIKMDSFFQDIYYNDEKNKHINNISIESNKITGNENIIGQNNNINNEMNKYIEIINKQQQQIDELISLLKQK